MSNLDFIITYLLDKTFLLLFKNDKSEDVEILVKLIEVMDFSFVVNYEKMERQFQKSSIQLIILDPNFSVEWTMIIKSN